MRCAVKFEFWLYRWCRGGVWHVDYLDILKYRKDVLRPDHLNREGGFRTYWSFR